MIRPQAKKAKIAKQFQTNLQKGDKIVTIAGIHGTVNKVNEDGTINLETSPGSYMKIEKSAISMEWTQNINKAGYSCKIKGLHLFSHAIKNRFLPVGIGSGKSTVAKIFEVLGIPVYYADDAAKRLMNEEGPLKTQIIQNFGEQSYKMIHSTAVI